MKRLAILSAMFALFLMIGYVSPVIAEEQNRSSTYPVFFDLNSSAIPESAVEQIEIAAELVRNLKDGGIDTIVALFAHADRSGSPEYNLQLSAQRGIAIRTALVRMGVPERRIIIMAWGSALPRPVTGDQIEPQHRRVEIRVVRPASGRVLQIIEADPKRVRYPGQQMD